MSRILGIPSSIRLLLHTVAAGRQRQLTPQESLTVVIEAVHRAACGETTWETRDLTLGEIAAAVNALRDAAVREMSMRTTLPSGFDFNAARAPGGHHE